MTRDDLLALRSRLHPLRGFESAGADQDTDQETDQEYGALLDAIGDARFVLIGEASHGTHEFYRERARLTRLLIEQKGFTAVAAEADWPDAYRVNRYVRGQSRDPNARAALGDFHRFPRWMWRNAVVEGFVEWLRGHNAAHPQRKVGFYGLDLYSLHRSMNAVVAYLETVDKDAAKRARQRYSCFDAFGSDPQAYGYATEHGDGDSCEDEAVQQLLELQRREAKPSGPESSGATSCSSGVLAGDELFYAEQNARLALNAEHYYRSVYRGRDESWNIRDTHMADTLDALVARAAEQGQQARVVVWAHNSHLGDARASASGQRGELNLGQLVRGRWPQDTFILGQSTYGGTVFAAHDWDEPGVVKAVNPGLSGSLEAGLHELARDTPNFWLDLRDPQVAAVLGAEQLQRFIGVIYRPQTERWSHYIETRPARQYDALLYFDQTRALTPLDDPAGDDDGELPQTYPTGE